MVGGGSRAIQKGERAVMARAGRAVKSEEGQSRPAPVVKRNGAKRTRRTSAGCLGGRDREARGKRTSRTCSRGTRGERRERAEREQEEEKEDGRCVCSDGTSGNEMHRNTRIYRGYERRRRRPERTEGCSEGVKKRGERNSDSRDARTAASLWCAKLPHDI